MKRIFFILTTFIGLLLLIAIIAEISLRIFWNGKPKPLPIGLINYFYPDSNSEISYVLRPNLCLRFKGYKIWTNKYGFRIPRNFQFEKKKDVFRMVLLGDSIVFGYHTPEEFTISSLITKELKKYKLSGINEIQTLNFAVPGYNMTQYLAVLKKYGLKYKPDVVVVGLAIINDFDGFFMSYFTNGLISPIPQYDSTGYNYEHKAQSRFLWNFYLFRKFYYTFTPSWEKRTKGPKNPPGEDRRYRKRLAASCNRNDEIWINIKKIMDEFKAISESENIKIVFLLFPTTEQIYYNNTIVHIPSTTQQIIKELLEKRKMQYIDLFNIFNASYLSSKQLPYRDLDSHPDNQGYKLSASLAVAWIADQKHFKLGRSFTGMLNMGETEASTFLSYGWTRIRHGGIKYRLAEGGESRIVFDKFNYSIKSIEIRVKKVDGCLSQKMTLYLNKQFLKSFSIGTAKEFTAYKIILTDPVRLKELNYLDLSFSCASAPEGWKSDIKNKSRCFSAAVSSVIIK